MASEQTPRRKTFRLPGTPRRVARDVDDELQFHLAMRIDELVRGGLTRARAEAEARREFGDVDDARAELTAMGLRRLRHARRAAWWDGLMRDTRYALRGLGREPGFTAAMVLTLGFGLGATAAMFGIVDRLLLRPPAHVVDPNRLGRLYFTETFAGVGVVTQASASYPDYVPLRDSSHTLSEVAAFWPTRASLGHGAEAQEVRRVAVTGNFFRTLGVRPALGRFFTPDDDEPPSGSPLAVVSDGFWRRSFGGDSAALGRSIEVGPTTYTVIGVAPPGFTGVNMSPVDVWVPLSTIGEDAIGEGWDHAAGWRWIQLVGRLAPGYSAEQVSAEATPRYRATHEQLADDPNLRVALGSIIAARGPRQGIEGGVSEAQISLWLSGVAVLVLLIACANAANLLLARAVRRRKEIGVRVALGVGRARLVSQLLVESLLLALLGGVVGLGLARWGGGALRSALLPSVAWRENALDPRLLMVAGATVLLVAVVTGLAPALHAVSDDVAGTLKAGAREGSRRHARLRSGLVLVQTTLSVILLVGAGLFIGSLRNIHGLRLGFDARQVLVVTVSLPHAGLDEREAFYDQARERLRMIPVVERASIAMTVPFYSSAGTDLSVPGLDSLPRTRDGGPYINAVTPEFFATLGTRIVRGRGFTDGDGFGAPRVAVVSATMARMLWPDNDPLGRCLYVGGDTVPCSTVVGVAQDAYRASLEDVPVMQYYVPLAQRQSSMSLRALFVRIRGNPAAALAAVRHEVQSLSPDLPYANIRSLLELVDPEVRPWKLGATLFGLFGVLALALAALGLYSVVAYTVTQRAHEMGLRVALGARGADVAMLVLGGTLRVVGAGVVIGLLVTVIAAHRVEPLLFHVSPRDPAVLFGVAAVLAATGVVASILPARRAAAVDPVTVLTAE